jgi:ABC-type sulfate/molybdate transport systems ATPase subunit
VTDKIVVMNQGKIDQGGTAAEIYDCLVILVRIGILLDLHIDKHFLIRSQGYSIWN